VTAAADDVRVQSARRWLASFPPDPVLVGMTAGQLVSWASRMHAAAQLLDAYVRDGERAVAEDTRRLDTIRGVLSRFDWELDDRQYTLELIDRIADGGQK
jgi:hypothetical protein